MREKLIELLKEADRYEFEEQKKKGDFSVEVGWKLIADHLIANGVTLDNQVSSIKWIPVTEQEEPTENGTYLCHGYWFGSRRKQTETADFFGEWNIANNFILTHWMPLPEPPKGE